MEQSSERDTDQRTVDALDRWAAWLGTTLAAASLGLVALADFGRFQIRSAFAVLVIAAVIAAAWWRPRPRLPQRGQAKDALLAALILLIGIALIAPGSENIAGPRDQAVYVATGFAIAHGGSTTIFDPALRLVVENTDVSAINAWLYENNVNHFRIRFPAQLFLHGGLEPGFVEGGFLPIVPVWIAFAASLGGLEAALHVAGLFGILALGFTMLACAAAARGSNAGPAPSWPLAGVILALSFSQIWWAREPMAESALGAWTWLAAWAAVRWNAGGGYRWATLAALAGIAGLFTRADGILLVAGLCLLFVATRSRAWWVLPAIVVPGFVAAELHYIAVATSYMSTTYSPFTLGRASGGVIGVALATAVVAISLILRRLDRAQAMAARVRRPVILARRGIVLVLTLATLISALSGVVPGGERDAAIGADSPLAWLPGYVPWPLLILAAIGFAALGWRGVPRPILPLLLIGGIPALFYLPDPLVTGDHPWMVRRLVPATIPLLAIAASIGARSIWQAPRVRMPFAPLAGQGAAAILIGLSFALAVAMDRDLLGPRHGAGAAAGISALASGLPEDAFVVFAAGSAGIHYALPLDLIYGVDAFAIPEAALDTLVAKTLRQIESLGHPTYWAADGDGAPAMPAGVLATPIRTVRIRYRVADHGLRPPPLDLGVVDDVVTLYRLTYETP